MLKTLFKKQLAELFSWLIIDKKSSKMRSKQKMLLFAVLYAFCLGSVSVLFFGMAKALCEPLLDSGLGWLYFALSGLIAVMLGVFGSVFNTYTTLYLANDNDLLLSLPVKPSMILFVRLFGVWIWGLVFNAIAFVPAIIVYMMTADFNVFALIFSVLVLFLISVFVLTLSCVLGWIIAKISSKLKNKNVITVIVSLAFFAAYYLISAKSQDILSSLILNAETIGSKIKGFAYPLYCMGKACEGNILHMLIFALLVAALFGVVYAVLSHGFLKLATTNRGNARREYKEKMSKSRSAGFALTAKELRRFTSSPVYMLNCGLGILLLPVFGIFALIKGSWFIFGLSSVVDENMITVLVCAAICMIATMNDISAPSVSLEGKNIWIAQSLPVSSWQVLKAKIIIHLILTEIPAFFCSVCLAVALKVNFFSAIMMIVMPQIYVLFSASFGLAVNLKTPNLNWTNETVPVKQSISIAAVLFGSWLVVCLLTAPYFFFTDIMPPEVYLVICSALMAAVEAILLNWLKNKGSRIFSKL